MDRRKVARVSSLINESKMNGGAIFCYVLYVIRVLFRSFLAIFIFKVQIVLEFFFVFFCAVFLRCQCV